MKMFTWWNPFSWARPKMKWKMVKTIRVTQNYDPYFIHLFESETGKRRWEVTAPSKMFNIKPTVVGLNLYHETIYPWLHGRYVKSIPLYSDIDSIEVFERLS